MTAELVAIIEALNEIEKKAARKDKIVILTDSLAASISLQNHHKQQTRQDLTEEITKKKKSTHSDTERRSQHKYVGSQHIAE